MDIMIDENSIEDIKLLLKENDKSAVRLSPIGYA